MVYLGTFNHILDNKNRLSVPARFINALGNEVVVNKGFDGCLELRSAGSFEIFVNSLMALTQTKKDSRIVIRQLLANAANIEIDKNKRLLIPTNLLQEANIEKNVVIIGVGDKIELWDEQKYQEFKNSSDQIYEAVAEKLEYDK